MLVAAGISRQTTPMRIDHVLLATADIEATAERWLAEYGLGSVAGGEHREWGTGNRIVPVGDAYVELFGIRDTELAARTPIGRWIGSSAAAGDRFVAVSLGTSDLDRVCARTGLEPVAGHRVLDAGGRVEWRMAGVERAIADGLPFFIQWSDPERGPGVAPARERARAGRFARVEVGGDQEELRAWVGEDVAGIAFVGGPPGIGAVTIETGAGDVILPARP